jgi:hypothetical protein
MGEPFTPTIDEKEGITQGMMLLPGPTALKPLSDPSAETSPSPSPLSGKASPDLSTSPEGEVGNKFKQAVGFGTLGLSSGLGLGGLVGGMSGMNMGLGGLGALAGKGKVAKNLVWRTGLGDEVGVLKDSTSIQTLYTCRSY